MVIYSSTHSKFGPQNFEKKDSVPHNWYFTLLHTQNLYLLIRIYNHNLFFLKAAKSAGPSCKREGEVLTPNSAQTQVACPDPTRHANRAPARSSDRDLLFLPVLTSSKLRHPPDLCKYPPSLSHRHPIRLRRYPRCWVIA